MWLMKGKDVHGFAWLFGCLNSKTSSHSLISSPFWKSRKLINSLVPNDNDPDAPQPHAYRGQR